jgi:hypothetical protein
MDSQPNRQNPPILRLVEPGEMVQVITQAADAHLLLTDRRLAVASGERIALDMPLPRLRRIQFDIERRRPATLVIVPEDATYEPQVISIPPSRYNEITAAIAEIGHRIADLEDTG